MEVVDALPTVAIGIEHQAKSALGDAFLLGQLGPLAQEISQQLFVGLFGIEDIIHFFFWNDKDVDRGLRVDVADRDTALVFVDDVGGDFLFDDFLKNSHRDYFKK